MNLFLRILFLSYYYAINLSLLFKHSFYSNIFKQPLPQPILFSNFNDIHPPNIPIHDINILNPDIHAFNNFDYFIIKSNNFSIPFPPPNYEHDIIDDSFEGFLRNEFLKNYDFLIHSNRLISFTKFYHWRKNIVGTLWRHDELFHLFFYFVPNDLCDLMTFIKLNQIIDENDGAHF